MEIDSLNVGARIWYSASATAAPCQARTISISASGAYDVTILDGEQIASPDRYVRYVHPRPSHHPTVPHYGDTGRVLAGYSAS